MRLPLPAAALAALLAACVPVPGFQEPPRLYTLTPVETFSAPLARTSEQLLIEAPSAPAGLDTARIALRTAPTNLDYFANVNWTDRAPSMVQNLLVESFERSRAIRAVGRDTSGLRADWVLRSELRDFEAEYPGDPARTVPSVRVALNGKLISSQRRSIEASETFEAVVPARDASFAAVIEAFDQAVELVLQGAVSWTLGRLPRE
ncbi:ABC-type transport auxiliary lipoprotein family protein [Arenibaculum pallidiluteum]|uniref:ABC-type transport auxiliary lipoprotein family protein n=1 Tax=Arenibaculum pallidiluteum TaxID=2812559 RepID=UPI001A96D208|nr:ABC-type transport auxiliary lipoprotein family protein [Arenibaculum pallidiluteum]